MVTYPLVRNVSVAGIPVSIKVPLHIRKRPTRPINLSRVSSESETHLLPMLSTKAAPVFALFEMLSLLFFHSQEWFARLAYGLRPLFLLAVSLQSSRSLLLHTVSTMH